MKNKKGFTIVELVIVISVIAILAAVLIPTFSGLVKKANSSADQQAVRNMNTILAMEEVEKELSIADVHLALNRAGMSSQSYRPLTDGTSFYWITKLNRVVLVDEETKNIIYPENMSEMITYNEEEWIPLNL